MPLVGQRAERLGQQPEAADLDRQLAPAGGHDLALDADPVAEVEPGELGQRFLPHVALGDEQLDGGGAVPQGGEDELALPADQQEAAGHPHGHPGLGAGFEGAELLVERGGGAVAVEADRVGVAARRPDRLDLGETAGVLVFRRGGALAGFDVGHRLRSYTIRRP
jgi:hypothetical protein